MLLALQLAALLCASTVGAVDRCNGRPVTAYYSWPPLANADGATNDRIPLRTLGGPAFVISVAFNQQVSVQFPSDLHFELRGAPAQSPLWLENSSSIPVLFRVPVRSPYLSSYSPSLSIATNVTLHVGFRYTALLPAAAFHASRSGQNNDCLSSALEWDFTVVGNNPWHNASIPAQPAHFATVVPVLNALSQKRVEAVVRHVSEAYYNRYYDSASGAAAAEDLRQTMAQIPGWSALKVVHPFAMPSGVFSYGTIDAPSRVVVVGAHLDSIDRQNMTVNVESGKAPGADDDGSGVGLLVALAEAVSSTKLQLPAGTRLDLHLYSAEEEGLFGSALVSALYAREGISVASMLMIDQAGWVRNPAKPVAAYFTDHTDPELNKLVVACAKLYVPDLPLVESNENGRADSDFHSWWKWDYRTAYVAEGPVDDIVYGNAKHTSTDTIAGVDFPHAMSVGKIVFSALLEVALY